MKIHVILSSSGEVLEGDRTREEAISRAIACRGLVWDDMEAAGYKCKEFFSPPGGEIDEACFFDGSGGI